MSAVSCPGLVDAGSLTSVEVWPSWATWP